MDAVQVQRYLLHFKTKKFVPTHFILQLDTLSIALLFETLRYLLESEELY